MVLAPPSRNSCEQDYAGPANCVKRSYLDYFPLTHLSEHLTFRQKDSNPNAVTLEGVTPLEGTGAFWQLRTREPWRQSDLRKKCWCMYLPSSVLSQTSLVHCQLKSGMELRWPNAGEEEPDLPPRNGQPGSLVHTAGISGPHFLSFVRDK